MPKALIARFSQTGTTSRVADQIAGGIRSAGWSAGWSVDVCDISAASARDIGGYDVVGVGTPVYGFRPPFLIQDYVRSLPDLSGKGSFVFVLYGINRGACGNWMRARLEEKGSRDLGYLTCRGADYFVGYIRRGYLFSPDSPTEDDLAAAEQFGARVVKRYDGRADAVEEHDPPTHLMYWLERFLMNRFFVQTMYSKMFRASTDCVSCRVCVNACPTHNITKDKNGRPKWHSNCLFCGTCELKCPKDAIRSAYDWSIIAPFMSYNINKALHESTPYAQVEHSGGRTRRVE
jgi:flavodoxin/ferredoxin